MEKTVLGKKCLKCASFLKENEVVCKICGFNNGVEEKIESKLKKTQYSKELPNILPCPKCTAKNNLEYAFCINCGFQLKESKDIPSRTKRRSEISFKNNSENLTISLKWKKANFDLDSETSTFTAQVFKPFNGFLEWKDFFFFIYQNKGFYETIIKKKDTISTSKLFLTTNHPVIFERGMVFFIGNIQCKLSGTTFSDKTVLRDLNKTYAIGPGEVDSLNGQVGIEILNKEGKGQKVNISDRTLIGRDFLIDNYKYSKEQLRISGVSERHLFVTPFKNGRWLIEPLKNKFFYREILKIPLRIIDTDLIRWVDKDRMGEFFIRIEENLIK